MREQKNFIGLFQVEKCRGRCPNVIIDTEEITAKICKALENMESLKKETLLYHQISRIAVAGCPNACSQPQIKDMGLIGRLKIKFLPELCSQCGICLESCKEKAIENNDGLPEIQEARCIGCGDCLKVCPSQALQKEKIGLRVLAGGKLGRHPVLAKEVHSFATMEEALEYLVMAYNFLKEHHQGSATRLSTLVQERGMDVCELFTKKLG